VEGGPEPAEPRRQAVALAVLAYLATHPRPVSLGELMGAIWPLQPDDGDTGPTRKTVFNVISRARTQLGRDDQGRDLLVYDGAAYSLSSEVTSDWVRFQRLCTIAARQPEDEARKLYRQALELVGGPPFAAVEGSEFYQWVWAESLDSAITATVVDTAETLAALSLDAEDFEVALWAVEKGLSLDPARERLYQTWMHICGRSGRADRVTDIYKRLCSMLKARIDPTLVPSAESEGIWKSYLNTDMGEARTADD
jgi:DNA-binding SARP family transcriptional activator